MPIFRQWELYSERNQVGVFKDRTKDNMGEAWKKMRLEWWDFFRKVRDEAGRNHKYKQFVKFSTISLKR